jgi:hypothetical protein
MIKDWRLTIKTERRRVVTGEDAIVWSGDMGGGGIVSAGRMNVVLVEG